LYREKIFGYQENYSFYRIQWNFKVVPVFRLLNNDTFVNNFFSSGELFVSCFEEFKKHPNESLRDIGEGHFIIGGQNQNGDTNVYIGDSGVNAYVLSTTTQITEKLKKDFSIASIAIKVNNPTLFALEVARQLPSISSGVEGYCEYLHSKVQILDQQSKLNSILQNHKFANDAESHNILNEISDGRELFAKDIKYRDESEYRFIWFSDTPVNESKLIKCPEAIKYCEIHSL
jgi:hypothetical protein